MRRKLTGGGLTLVVMVMMVVSNFEVGSDCDINLW